ncbi:MAG: GntR family transcriptional regulator, partial [Thermoleophilia bacterium]|nr:GntR family transcriptional regulator [Thermoleophilia bacterium]
MATDISVIRPAQETLAQRAYTELRDRIVSLELPPGTPLSEDGLTA